MKHLLVIASLLAILPGPSLAAKSGPKFRALVFSKTVGFRHDSIPDGVAAVKTLGEQNRFAVDATEDAAVFTPDNLKRYRVVVFLNTTGDILDDAQQAAFERYVRKGGGFVGIHSATDTEYNWPFYAEFVGAQFASHPHIQQATITVEDRTHPSTKGLPYTWVRTDEWYNFKENPRGKVCVLARLEESTYQGGTMPADHPIAWCRLMDGGRGWYTEGGHTRESFREPEYLSHLLGGIRWAAGDVKWKPKSWNTSPNPPRPAPK